MFGIIINEQGYKTAFVCIDENDNILHYTLKENEQLIKNDWQIANAMGKPKWTGTEWVDEEPPKQIDNCTGPTVEEQLLATQKMVLSLQEQIIDML
ncbi:hypothetical protein [Cellulosilyticum sp. WCF-2]|uniref:hypothetical protein n=1 Tax=Cellulosilyticum sp. WCF-2 TaxID=2497860 RepID=UPI000F8DD30E|nr:hypothetical protein [Cellulosilyticum sp. WCF-2]QEH68229.1 hypothetical protein EKH84_07430 [Cellulosilyticum sp. WCF-2]